MTTLDSLKKGERARIAEIEGDDAVSIRLMEMGLIEGEEIELLNFAPLGDPVEYLIRGYRLSLRRNEARRVKITPCPAAPAR
jgi:Fe2+ transport system protein FeoA